MPVAPELLGPYGLVIGALVLIGLLLKDHKRADDEDRRQRDEAIAGWKDATAAVNRLAAALEERNRRDAYARRAGDE